MFSFRRVLYRGKRIMAIHAPRKKFFIKITGDLADDREDVLEWIGQRAKEAFTVVCIGGGTRISEACAKDSSTNNILITPFAA